MTFAPGTRVTWLHEQRGGYGYVVPVAGVVVRTGRKRVLIRVARRVLGGEWETLERWVDLAKLKPRHEYVPQVDGT